MKRYALLLLSALLAALTLGACSPKESAPVAPVVKREVSLPAIAEKARGFAVGSMMSANPVYVFFDPQCPHCGQLWNAAAPLLAKVKFVWIPVGLINATSTAQSAAILTAPTPATLMSEHEALLLAGKGGISASSSMAPEVAQAIKDNTALLTSFGAESVPFMVARNLKSGQTISREGAMPTPDLAAFLGLDAP